MDNVPHNTEAEQLAHSGDLGLEKPEREFDNTTLPEAFDKHLTDTDGNVIVPDNASAVAVEKESSVETPKKRGKIWAIGAAAVAAITGVSLAIGLNLPKGDHDNTAPTPDDKATSQPSTNPTQGGENSGNKGETNGSYANPNVERVINNPDRISPDKIAAMSPQELTDFATISYEEAPNPEAYAKRFVTVYDAWMNAGATKEEFAPYENSGKGVYEQAMADKYDKVFISSLFGISDLNNITSVHNAVMNGYMASQMLESKTSYTVATVYKGIDVISDSGTSNGFKIVVHAEVANNPEETIHEVLKNKDTYQNLDIELTVGSIDGNYKIMSIVETAK